MPRSTPTRRRPKASSSSRRARRRPRRPFAAQVQVTGTVSEFVPEQRSAGPAVHAAHLADGRCSSPTGNPLPAPVPLTATFPDPAGPFDQFERVEHMRVSVASITVSGPSAGQHQRRRRDRHEQRPLPWRRHRRPRPFREAGIQAPDPPPSGSIPPIPRWDFNPERIRIDSAALTGQAALTVRRATSSDRSPVRSTTVPRATRSSPTARARPWSRRARWRRRSSAAAGHEVTVASFNLQRFFDAVDDPGVDDSVLTPAAYDTRLEQGVDRHRQHLRHPDIIAVQEVENLTALQNLAAHDQRRVGADSTTRYLVEGNDVAGLDVGFLVKR